jgi:glutamyl-Q tRNA(Asp) synthetase
VITRFAPSPTGNLHLGHAFSALLAFEEAQRTNGTFLLRIEDIDRNRCHPDHETAIYRDLAWLGIHWQGEPVRQSTRGHAYQDAIRQLSEKGLLYPCFCSRKKIREELANLASAPHHAHPVYPGTCRNLRPEEREQRILSGEPHGLRLDTPAALAVLPDAARSWQEVEGSTFLIEEFLCGDEIIMRKDIGTSYHLAVVVDDAWQNIDRIIRGEDLRASTAIHRVLQGLLGYPLPDYHHHRLILDEDGRRLAKRDATTTLAHHRESGVSPAHIRAMLGF